MHVFTAPSSAVLKKKKKERKKERKEKGEKKVIDSDDRKKKSKKFSESWDAGRDAVRDSRTEGKSGVMGKSSTAYIPR